MAVEILLMEDVAELGTEGDVVKVADGYARNFLFPRKLGAPVTQGMRRRLARLQEQRQKERTLRDEQARALAEAIARDSYTIAVKVSDAENLYGSVTAGDIADLLARGGHTVDKDWIVLETPIRQLGVYDVAVHVPPAADATIKIWVVEE